MYRYGLAGRGQWWKSWTGLGGGGRFLNKVRDASKRPDGMAGKLLATRVEGMAQDHQKVQSSSHLLPAGCKKEFNRVPVFAAATAAAAAGGPCTPFNVQCTMEWTPVLWYRGGSLCAV